MDSGKEARPKRDCVEVAVNIRPLITSELLLGGSDCITVLPGEPQVQIRSNTFTFDHVYGSSGTPSSAIFDECVLPLVDAVFQGYNATVIAYGQTGSGKSFTMGTNYQPTEGNSMGLIPQVADTIFKKIDTIKDNTEFFVRVSFIEVFNEEVFDLLVPNLPDGFSIAELKRPSLQIRETVNGGITLPRVTEEKIQSKEEMLLFLSRGTLSRATTSTNMNSKSSRSHAVFTVLMEQRKSSDDILSAKLHLVDLAGSERAKRTAADGLRFREGISINKGLLALGNVISAFGDEKKQKEGGHVPYRDSKLTRLLQDSLGGNTKTLMIACISPSDTNADETINTLKYANRARNIENKAVVNRDQVHCRVGGQTSEALEKQQLEKKVAELTKQLKDESVRSAGLEDQLQMKQKETEELKLKVEEMFKLNKEAGRTIHSLEVEKNDLLSLKKEIEELKLKFEEMFERNEDAGRTIHSLEVEKNNLLSLKEKSTYKKDDSWMRSISGLGGPMNARKSNKRGETISAKRATIFKIFEGVGFANILASLKSKDLDEQIHAAIVMAYLTIDDINQERIVEEGGLDALLVLLGSSENATIHRVTAGAIANLSMNGSNQVLIMCKGGARLLANIAWRTDDPQTLCMVSGAIANLCGNDALHAMLEEDGATRALFGMVRFEHSDVIAQVARGMANFAKSESRAILKGLRKGKSLLIEDGALKWIIDNNSTTAYSTLTKQHIELALCHLAKNEDNGYDIITMEGVKELVRISRESTREDMRMFAKKILNSNPSFLAETQKKYV